MKDNCPPTSNPKYRGIHFMDFNTVCDLFNTFLSYFPSATTRTTKGKQIQPKKKKSQPRRKKTAQKAKPRRKLKMRILLFCWTPQTIPGQQFLNWSFITSIFCTCISMCMC